MRLKSFYAKTMNEAMQMVRDTLGDDAVIVATREDREGNAVHVTAAIDPAFEVGHANDRASNTDHDNWLQYDEENDEDQIAEALTDNLLRHAVPEDVIDHIVSCATVVGLQNPYAAMSAALEHLFTFQPMPASAFKKPIMMMGPQGAGKTIAVAKSATRAVMNGLRVAIITCDTVRAGGIEQLAAFADLLRIDLHKAETTSDLKSKLHHLQNQGYDQIFIDTPGINPFDKKAVRDFALLINGINALNVLVLPAGIDNRDSAEIARIFNGLGATFLMPSRMDAARRMGGILAAAHEGNLTFSDAGNSPKVANGLISLTPNTLCDILMPKTTRSTNQAQSSSTARKSIQSRH